MEQENLQSIITDDELSKLIDGVSAEGADVSKSSSSGSVDGGEDSGGGVGSEVEVDLTDRVSKYRDAILDVETGGLWGRYRVLSEGGDEEELIEFYNEVMKKDVDIDELEGKEREKAIKRIRRELEGHFGKVADGVMGNFRVKVSGGGGGGSGSSEKDIENFNKKVSEVIDLIDSGELSIGGYKLSGIKQAVGGDYTFVGGDERELLARLAIVSNDSAFNYFVRAIASELGRRIVKEVSRRYAGAGTGVVNPGATGLTGGGTNKVLEALSARARQHVIKEV